MKSRFPRPALYLFLTGTLTCACVHTPPGTSVEIALAKKPELVRLPAPPPSAVAASGPGASGIRVAAVEPELPTSDVTERVADAYTRGQFCLKTGNNEDAIQAFLEVVALDPNFSDAWHYLAALYEKTGQDEKALAAFRKSKNMVQH